MQHHHGEKMKGLDGWVCNVQWGGEKCIKDFFCKPGGKRPLASPGHRWRLMLSWFFGKWDGCGLDSSGL